MSNPERLTQAKTINGKLCILQPDGSWVEARSETDLSRADSFSEEDIQRMSEEDGDADWFDEDSPWFVVEPGRHDAAE